MKKNEFEKEFNLLIVDTFHNILKTELKMINKITNSGLSMREIHLLEIVANEDAMTVSKIAKSFGITLASVTVMVNKLVTGGYISKTKCEDDARNNIISLTLKGKKINDEHNTFHRNMIRRIAGKLNDKEKGIMVSGIKSLNEMFKNEFDDLQ